MIQAREVYYDNNTHCYTSRIFLIRESEIESITEDYDSKPGAKSRIITKTNYVAYCKNAVDEIMQQMKE